MSSSSLASVLSRTDGSAVSIQQAASKMMSHYSKSPQVAVTEWRNCLQTCRESQLLPLLYVANEVLQNSKRNRGTAFLEAFSPILGQSLLLICQRDPSVVEKVRRTAKIWGERRVYSTRFVGELLHGLDQFRKKDKRDAARFSPPTPSSPQKVQEKRVTPEPLVLKDEIEEGEKDNDDDDFAFEEPSQHLDLDLSQVATSAVTMNEDSSYKKRKRRLSSSPEAPTPKKASRRKSLLSTASLVDLWNQVSQLELSFKDSQTMLSTISPENWTSSEELEQLVGDELLEAHREVTNMELILKKQRHVLHSIAQDRRALEQEAVTYIPWLRQAAKMDQEDLNLCDSLEQKLNTIRYIHKDAKAARDARVQSEAESRERARVEQLRKEQEAERKRMLDNAIKVESEAKPGMVWNKATQEYQYLNTEESWRD